MNIRIIDESDAPSYQAVRLRGLQINPEAFGSTYEREAAFSLETVMDRIRPAPGKFILGAFDGETLMGVVTFMRENGVKSAHKGNVFGMFIVPERRGQGIGKRLMVELIRRAAELEGLEQINLSVVSNNTAGKRLYRSVGFTVYGKEMRALKHLGRYFDEELMTLHFADS